MKVLVTFDASAGARSISSQGALMKQVDGRDWAST
jgi:hypothetical protein